MAILCYRSKHNQVMVSDNHQQSIYRLNDKILGTDTNCPDNYSLESTYIKGNCKDLRKAPKTKLKLDDMVQKLSEKCDFNQIAIADKYGSKVIYASNIKLVNPPIEYKKRGVYNSSKQEAYNTLFENLKNTIQANPGALKKTIEKILDYNHGILQRYKLKKHYKLSSKQLQKALDKEYQDKHIGCVAIKTRNHIEHAMKIEKTGLRARPLYNLPFIVITGEKKDLKKIKKAEFCHGVYTPELIMSFVTGNNIIPITKKQTLWNLTNIGADKARTSGNGINIAVVDTGVDYHHHELTSRFLTNKGYDFIEDNSEPLDKNGHGTHVAGTIGGTTTGVAPSSTLFAARVLDARGSGRLDNILRAVDWCITKQMDVANFSLGSMQDSFLEKQLFDKAMQAGVICVAAAGNEGYGPNYPASYNTVVAVAAVDRFNNHPSFSNIYHTNNVSAPGVGIFSALPGNDFGVLSGTSMASPHVAGCAALTLQAKDMSTRGFIKMLEKTSKKIGDPRDSELRDKFGAGLVRADKLSGAKRWRKSA